MVNALHNITELGIRQIGIVEKVLGSLIYYRESDIRIVKVPGEMWCEIDNEDDLFRANRRFRA